MDFIFNSLKTVVPYKTRAAASGSAFEQSYRVTKRHITLAPLSRIGPIDERNPTPYQRCYTKSEKLKGSCGVVPPQLRVYLRCVTEIVKMDNC
jgi:hypothetical protein